LSLPAAGLVIDCAAHYNRCCFMTAITLPFLTLFDAGDKTEGALDPLGLATTGDRLANWILPGLTARMSRPRFLTAMAVASAVCDGLEEETASDHLTPACIVFEWLLVEGFARCGKPDAIKRTPGIDKARATVAAQLPMSATHYLKTPGVFGFHGVYSRLARHLGLLDEAYRLRDSGYELVKIWEQEEQLDGFIAALSRGTSSGSRQALRAAVEDGLQAGYSKRSTTWQGWAFFAGHLTPARIGKREAAFIRQLLCDPGGDRREEIFQLMEQLSGVAGASESSEAAIVERLLPHASHELARRFETIKAYEQVCGLIEDAFDWLRYLSSQAGTRALRRDDFASHHGVSEIAEVMPKGWRVAGALLDDAPPQAQREFAALARFFDDADSGESLFEALLARHAHIQRAKPPEGKREWFERAADGSLFVRPLYRLDEPPRERDDWSRPYRMHTVMSFCRDLQNAG